MKKIVLFLFVYLFIKPYTISATISHNHYCGSIVVTTAATAMAGGLGALICMLTNRYQYYTEIPDDYNLANDEQVLIRQQRCNRIMRTSILASLGVAALSGIALVITVAACS